MRPDPKTMILTGLLMSAAMSLTLSAFFTWLNAPAAMFLPGWARGFALGWPLAFAMSMLLGRPLSRLAARLAARL